MMPITAIVDMFFISRYLLNGYRDSGYRKHAAMPMLGYQYHPNRAVSLYATQHLHRDVWLP